MTTPLSGWFKVHRAMLSHPVWQLSEGQRCVWLTILALANHKPGEWFDGKERVSIPAGSFVTSQHHLAAAAGVSRIVVRHGLNSLEVLGSIRAKVRAKRWTLIEVVNWPLYQGAEDELSQEASPRRAKGEPSASHNGRREECKKRNTFADDGASAPLLKEQPKAPKPRNTDPETDTLLREFAERFQAKFGEPYLIEWGRDRKAMGGLLAVYGAASVRAKLAVFFEHGTAATRERRAWTVPEFRRVFPQLIVMQSMGDV